ncbi:MAG: hypothetical protein WBG46_13895 [Nonlabens sp.]
MKYGLSLLVLIIYTFSSCSSEDDGARLSGNGFIAEGEFYDTALTNEIIFTEGSPQNGSSISFEFSDIADPSGLEPSRGHYAYFYIRIGEATTAAELERTYRTSVFGDPVRFGFSEPWGFRDLYERNDFISGGSFRDEDRVDANVVINEIELEYESTSTLGSDRYRVTYLDMDYTISADGSTVRGTYIGDVNGGLGR